MESTFCSGSTHGCDREKRGSESWTCGDCQKRTETKPYVPGIGLGGSHPDLSNNGPGLRQSMGYYPTSGLTRSGEINENSSSTNNNSGSTIPGFGGSGRSHEHLH